ncbi:hypothetical protein JCM33374_g5591 [Metschnikowia sp. JCM 33374]|nr:hypothetical protein JCM33374_g5591 [Metschnikowia sp. JCM 33374]
MIKCLASITTENQRKTVQVVPWNAMTLFCWPTARRCENNYNFDTWDDYADMGESVPKTILTSDSYDKETSAFSQPVVKIDLLDDEETHSRW